MKKLFALILAIAMSLSLIACGGNNEAAPNNEAPNNSETASSDKTANGGEAAADNFSATIQLGHTSNEQAPLHLLSVRFKEILEEKTNGKISVDVYPNSQLGSDAEMLTGLINGDIQMWVGSTTPVAPYIPECAIFDAPGLFNSVDHCNEVYASGEITDTLNEMASDLGFQFAFLMANDWRGFSCNAPVRELADFTGLDIRVAETPFMIAYVEALGASAVPMPFGEVAVAMQQGLIDAQYNPVDSPVRNKFYEFQDYFLDTQLTMYTVTSCINTEFYNSLPDTYKALFDEAVAQLHEEGPAIIAGVMDAYRPQLEENGMEVITYTAEQRQEMIDATLPVLEEMYRNDFGDEFVDSVFAACGK